eukprot:COSAG02_NODE_177_length_31154_cov_32.205152_19_plen_125_part_00
MHDCKRRWRQVACRLHVDVRRYSVSQGLVGITMSRDVIKFPIFSGSLLVFYLLFGYITNSVVLPRSAVGSSVPARTATFLNATMAPGLSSFTFINEFGGPGAAGLGSLMDVRMEPLKLRPFGYL